MLLHEKAGGQKQMEPVDTQRSAKCVGTKDNLLSW